jgi:coenzyme F420-reducing hydrogenase delta subunit/cytochrome c2
MIERTDGRKHRYLAQIDSKFCVGCGICIGTCDPLALAFGNAPAESLWEDTLARISEQTTDPVKVVFTCERHVMQGAKAYLRGDSNLREAGGPLMQVVPLTCIGMAHPNLAAKALDAGAAEVQFIGCPPEDCANREGNLWMQERLDRVRLPKLKSSYSNSPIYTDWLPPNEFSQALAKPNTNKEATSYKLNLRNVKLLTFLPSVILLGMVMIFQVWLSDVRYQPYPSNVALLEVALNHRSGYPLKEATTNLEPELGLTHPTRLILEVDSKTLLDKSYPPQGTTHTSIAFEQFPLSADEHLIRLTMFDRPDQSEELVIYEQSQKLTEYDILRLNYSDRQVSGDPTAGEKLFKDRSIGASGSCSLCHSLEAGEVLVGPSLAGIASSASERIPGMSAEEYLYQSILKPDAFVVDGFPVGQMLPDLEKRLSPEQIDSLVAFLLTLK